MRRNGIVDILNETDNAIVEDFLEEVDTNVKISTKSEFVQFDYSWLDVIENSIEALDNIVRNPRKFIIQEEEVVPVERAKKISQETIKHLAQHTNLIQSVDEDGTITPSSVLNVHKEESFDIYENRFIASLLKNLSYFLQLRKEVTKQGSFSNAEKKMNFKGETKLNDETVKIDLNLESKAYKDLSAVSSSGEGVEARIAKIELIVNDFLKSQFMRELTNALPVRSPIRKTNVILKNQNFKKALELWEFLEKYDVTDKREAHESKDYDNTKEIKDKMDMSFFLDYAILNSCEDEPIKKSRKISKYYLKRMVNYFVNNNVNISEEQFKKMVNDEFASVKEKQIKFESKVIHILKNYIKKYEGARKKALAILK